MLTPFKLRNLSSFKQATKYFLQIQSNPEWSIAVLSLTFDVKKKKKFLVSFYTNKSAMRLREKHPGNT